MAEWLEICGGALCGALHHYVHELWFAPPVHAATSYPDFLVRARLTGAASSLSALRVMSGPNVANVCYDTAYMANLSEVEMYYPQTVTYWDGI